jgi:hypothetical protein
MDKHGDRLDRQVTTSIHQLRWAATREDQPEKKDEMKAKGSVDE